MSQASINANVALAEAARANLETGVLLMCKEALVTAIQDSRLHRGHLRVLAAIATCMSSKTAKAWPGRASIAAMLGLLPKTVSNILRELREFGYLIAERQQVEEADNRRLMVYTFGKIDHETIRQEITAFINGVREGRIPSAKVPPQWDSPTPQGLSKSLPSGTVPPQRAAKSPPSGHSNSCNGTPKKDDSRGGTYNRDIWAQTLNPTADVEITQTAVRLHGQLHDYWLSKFGNDTERLELVLVQILPYLQPHNRQPLEAQVSSQLARILGEKRDRDTRYASAAKASAAAPRAVNPANEHWRDKRDRENAEFLKVLRGEK